MLVKQSNDTFDIKMAADHRLLCLQADYQLRVRQEPVAAEVELLVLLVAVQTAAQTAALSADLVFGLAAVLVCQPYRLRYY